MTGWLNTALKMEKLSRYEGAEQERSIWYHGTRGRNLSSILSQGLIPNPKKREWADDPDANFIQPSKASLEGIYLTRNLGTARAAASRGTDKEAPIVIVAVEVQPRSLVADEDDVSYAVRNAVPGNSGKLAIENFMARELGRNSQFNEYSRDKYVKDCIRTIKARVLPQMHQEVETRLKSILEKGWDIALNRQSAYECSKTSSYDWDNLFFRNAPATTKEWFDKEVKELESKGVSYDDAYRQVINVITPKRPDAQAAEAAYASYMDELTRLLKNIARPSVVKEKFSHVARSLEPIGFSGSNKIICILEAKRNRQKYGDLKDRIKVVYGNLPDDLVQQWERNVGEIIIVKDWAEFDSTISMEGDELNSKVASAQ